MAKNGLKKVVFYMTEIKKKSFEELVAFNKSEEREFIRICFAGDGQDYFYDNEVKDKEKTAERFLELCLIVINNPEMIYHAFELCGKKEIKKKDWLKRAIAKIKTHPRRY